MATRMANAEERPSVDPEGVKFFAHTAVTPDGRPNPDTTRWQPLADHLRNVADLARRFAQPLRLGDEAELAGLLHLS